MIKKRHIIAILAVAMMFLILLLFLPDGMSVLISDDAGKVYFEKGVRPGDIVAMEFTHSVEFVQIVDNFIVLDDGRLMLTNTTFGSSGYGIPSEEFYNITVDEKGNYTITGINKTFKVINFITSNTPKHYLIVAGEKYPIYCVVPGEKPLILSVERISPAETLFIKIRAIFSV